jgi:Methyltransferase domain
MASTMTDRLAAADPHHWHPAPPLWAWLMDQIAPGARVLDVGAGYLPFPRADVLVDFVAPTNGKPAHEIVLCDFGREPLPFADKSFDFVYCRQTLEDMGNPMHALAEIERVGKAGYIETPSPIAELCRGVDGGAPHWRGYNHHRWIAWVENRGLRLVSKYPLVEYLDLYMGNLAARLRQGPRYWATYYLWRDKIDVAMLNNPLDFAMPDGYAPVLARACQASVAASDAFWAQIEKGRSQAA